MSVGRGGGLVGNCAGLCSTGPVSAGVQYPQWAHEWNLSAFSAALLLKVVVLHVTVYGYLKGKGPLRLFNKSRDTPSLRLLPCPELANYAKKGTFINKTKLINKPDL